MNMKRMSTVFCALTIFGTASLAMAGAYGEAEQAEEMPRSAPAAQEVVETDEFSPFPYFSVGGVYAKEFFEGDAHLVNTTYGWGWNARVGYRFVEMVAVEIFAEHIVEFDSDGGDARSTDRRAWSLMPQVKIYPIQGFAEPYISIGAGLFRGDHGHNWQIIEADVDGNPATDDPDLRQHDGIIGKNSGNGIDQGYGFGMRFGLGADFYATDNVFITPEIAYVLPLTADINNYNYLSVSLAVGVAFN